LIIKYHPSGYEPHAAASFFNWMDGEWALNYPTNKIPTNVELEVVNHLEMEGIFFSQQLDMRSTKKECSEP